MFRLEKMQKDLTKDEGPIEMNAFTISASSVTVLHNTINLTDLHLRQKYYLKDKIGSTNL